MDEALLTLLQFNGKPLRLQDLPRITIGKAVFGQYFKSRGLKLAQPTKRKAVLRADISRQPLKRVFRRIFYFSLMFFDFVTGPICFQVSDQSTINCVGFFNKYHNTSSLSLVATAQL